uniref:Uncharacterized protein n=1 Tax=Anguilla anguilla TaxID=7936 RepID=A0A0E9TU60_ANGAN
MNRTDLTLLKNMFIPPDVRFKMCFYQEEEQENVALFL